MFGAEWGYGEGLARRADVVSLSNGRNFRVRSIPTKSSARSKGGFEGQSGSDFPLLTPPVLTPSGHRIGDRRLALILPTPRPCAFIGGCRGNVVAVNERAQFLKDANTLLGELRHENIVVLIGMGNYIIPPACQPFADLR